MKDSFGRNINYLRLSVTDLCNLNCKYCSSRDPKKVNHSEILSIEEMTKIVEVCSEIGITKLRITGGEPLLKKGLEILIEKCSKIIPNICMTTNGVLLNEKVESLKKAGLKNINISLDSLDKNIYKNISSGDLDETLKGIEKAYKLGLGLKFNAVLQKGINDKDFESLLSFTKSKNAKFRFIELMPFSHTKKYFEDHYISSQELIKKFDMKFLYNEGTAEYYKYKDYEIGFISPISNKFCNQCSRIRITSFGEFIPCLHSNRTYSIKEFINNKKLLKDKIIEYLKLKPKNHQIEKGILMEKDMRDIGG